MPTIRLFHWKASEAEPLIALLRQGGYVVDYPTDQPGSSYRAMRDDPPMAAVIDLTRLPSHGFYVATAIRGNKGLRQIPIVFVDGDPAKLAKIRSELPDATFTTQAKLIAVLKKAKPVMEPLIAPDYMNRFADRSTAAKLGIKPDARVAMIDPPPDYLQILGELPPGASLEETAEEVAKLPEVSPLTLWFVSEVDAYLAGLRSMRKRAVKSKIWVIYPKLQAKAKAGRIVVKSATGLNQNFIRESALAVGLVDYKICSLNDVWSGMLFTVKK